MEIHYLNVDEGDCSIVKHDSGRITMIDICCGNFKEKQSLIEENLSVKEASEGIRGNFNQKGHPTNPLDWLPLITGNRIFRFIATHPDMDHLDGLNALFESKFKPCNFWDTENDKKLDLNRDFGKYNKEDWKLYQNLHDSKVSDVKTLFIKENAKGVFYNQDDNDGNGDRIQIISPSTKLEKIVNSSGNFNDISYVLLMTTRYNRKILFCGDTETLAWNLILKRHEEELSNIDILVAPHHGRKSGGNALYLDMLRPKITILGNAKSEYMDYTAWNNRKLIHYTNNQLGNAIFDDSDGNLKLYGTNQKFVFDFLRKEKSNFKESDMIKHRKYNAWKIQCL